MTTTTRATAIKTNKKSTRIVSTQNKQYTRPINASSEQKQTEKKR